MNLLTSPRLYPHQQDGAQWLLQNPKSILAYGMRVGKTRTAAAAALSADTLARGSHILVVCPAAVKLHWQSEFLALDANVKIDVVAGQKHKLDPNATVTIINYDLLHYYPELCQPRRALIIDEAHRIKSPTTKRTKAIAPLIHAAQFAWALTGTPIPNRPIELQPLLFHLGITRLDWYGFAVRYAEAWNAPWGLDVSGASNIEKLKNMLAPKMLRLTLKDINQKYTPPKFELVTFDKPLIKGERFDPTQLSNTENVTVAFETIAEIMKMSALKKIPDAAEFINDLLEHEEKVVVFAWHSEVIAALAEKLKAHKPVTYTGSSSQTQRQQAISAFAADKKVRLFIGNLQAAGEGIDLSAANVTVFVETNWAPAWLEQAAARTERANKEIPSTAYLLTTAKSIDHYVLNKIVQKLGTIEKVTGLASSLLFQPAVQLSRIDKMNDNIAKQIADALTRIATALEQAAPPAPTALAAKAKPAKPVKPATAEPEATQVEDFDVEPAATIFDIDAVRTLLIALDEKLGWGNGKQKIQDFGVNKLIELTPSQLQELGTSLTEELK